MKKSSIIVAFAILAITVGWIASGQFNNEEISKKQDIDNKNIIEEESINVRIKKSTAEPINKKITIQGQTKANKTINLKSEITGKIEKINVNVGEKISKSKLIFKISEGDKRSKFDRIKIEYEAEKELFEKNLSSKLKLAKIKSDYDTVKKDLEKTNIISPIEGIITSEHLEIGDFVQPGTTLATIVELDPILVIGYVSEKELKDLSLETNAFITTSLNEKLNGKITYISPVADKGTRTFKIEITLENKKYNIKDGLTASIEIQGKKINAHKISP